ncbi:MAG: winged helix-turn-helix domain-containing protein, partial [Candidatus Limnocylindria bacterium]
LGAVQLDTISVLARSHELVAYARLGPVGRAAVEAAYWGSPPAAFEYWAHAACVLPLEEWPYFAFRRRAARAKYPDSEGTATLRALLRARGPLTSADFGGARDAGGAGWWSWSPLKHAIEILLSRGEVVCVERRGWRRVYDLAERAIPEALRAREPSDEECRARLIALAAERLGVATVADLADYFRLTRRASAVESALLVAVRVRGWAAPAWADPRSLADLGAGRVRGRHRTALLSPFDSLVWYKPRVERVFGFRHAVEAYTPAAKRVHGYFPMPLLAGGRLVGRVDPGRSGRTLVAKRVSLEPAALEAMAAALAEAAAWVGCDGVAVEVVAPASLHAPLRAALRRVV